MRPMKYGASWKRTAELVGDVPVEIVAPSLNARGLVIHELLANHASSSSGVVNFLAKGSAPGNWLDGDLIVASGTVVHASASVHRVLLDKNIFIEPGVGLYVISAGSSGGISIPCLISVLYSLL